MWQIHVIVAFADAHSKVASVKESDKLKGILYICVQLNAWLCFYYGGGE